MAVDKQRPGIVTKSPVVERWSVPAALVAELRAGVGASELAKTRRRDETASPPVERWPALTASEVAELRPGVEAAAAAVAEQRPGVETASLITTRWLAPAALEMAGQPRPGSKMASPEPAAAEGTGRRPGVEAASPAAARWL